MVWKYSSGSSERGKLKEISKGKSLFVSQLFSTGAGWCCFGEQFFPPTAFKPGGLRRPIRQLVDLLTHGPG